MTSGCCDEKEEKAEKAAESAQPDSAQANSAQAACCGDDPTPAPRAFGASCCGDEKEVTSSCGCGAPSAREAKPACGSEAPAEQTGYRAVPTEGRVSTPAGDVTCVSTRWGFGDWLGRVLVRLGFGRTSYAVAPGLYAVGTPGPDSPVLVSANYKLSFDVLRRAARGLDAWILVLDTRGVNVWCAAGKGTFGTAELARRVEATRLADVVRHRRLVVPQLGAPSVAAHEVERLTDFGVVFGPVRAADIPAFLGRDYEATPEMRRVTFGMADRLEVAPLELVEAGRVMGLLSLLVLAVTAWDGTTLSLAWAWGVSAPVLLAVWSGVLAGTVLLAALLPWLPGRMFAVKGAVLGAVVAAALWPVARGLLPESPVALLVALALLTIAISSYLASNYTGCTTFTSLSGVKRELRLAIPATATALVVAAVLPGAALVLERILR